MGKIIFIEPKSPNLHIFSGYSLPRLGCILLGTIAEKNGWDVSVYIEEQHEIDWDDIASADIVGISTITSTAPRAYAIADQVRRMQIPVIMGGPHVTFLPEEALQHCDYLMRGEGEIAFPLFLKALENEYGMEDVPNLAYHVDETIRYNDTAEACTALDTLPYPDFSLVKGKPLVIAGHTVIPVQTSRGCPYDCSFCSVTGMFGRRFRRRSTENVLGELRQYNQKDKFLFIYDDNFAANPKSTNELLDSMIEEQFKFKWSAQVRADLARDTALVKKMKKAGCHTVFIGFETVNPESLKSIKKKESVDDLGNAAMTFRKAGINVHGMFILGLDDDNMDAVKETVKFAKRYRLSSAQFLILAPLPGTRCYQELAAQGRIAFTDWSLYDAHHVVFHPKHLTLADLQRAQIKAHKQFYSLKESVRRLVHQCWVDIGIAYYARHLNSNWKKRNKPYLKLLELLRPNKEAEILADFKQRISLENRVAVGNHKH